MNAGFSNAQTVCSVFQLSSLHLLVPYFADRTARNCSCSVWICFVQSFPMVNTRSGVHTFLPKMVSPRRRTARHRDVNPLASPLRTNIHGVRMHKPFSASAKRLRKRSSWRIRDDPIDPSPDVSHSQDILEVNPLVMILWSGNKKSIIPFVPQGFSLSSNFDTVFAFNLSRSLVVYTLLMMLLFRMILL